MNTPLPPFSDAAPCQKCGGADIDVQFHGGRDDGGRFSPCADLRQWADHLCRRCRRCGFQWMEACVDAGGKEKP